MAIDKLSSYARATDSHGTYHLASQTNDLFEVQRDNNFEFIVHFPENLYRSDDATRLLNTSDDNQEYIRLSVNKASVPHYSQEVIEIKRGNSTFKAAGVIKWDSQTLEVMDYIGADGKSILQAWQNLSGDVKSDTVGRMKDYKLKCELVEYTPDYKDVVRTYTLEGCWISKLSETDHSQESGSKRVITATIEFDKGYMDID